MDGLSDYSAKFFPQRSLFMNAHACYRTYNLQGLIHYSRYAITPRKWMKNKITLAFPFYMRMLGVTVLLFVLCVNGSDDGSGSSHVLQIKFLPTHFGFRGDVLDKTDGSYADTPLVDDFCARWSMHFASFPVGVPACARQQQQRTRSIVRDRPLIVTNRIPPRLRVIVI